MQDGIILTDRGMKSVPALSYALPGIMHYEQMHYEILYCIFKNAYIKNSSINFVENVIMNNFLSQHFVIAVEPEAPIDFQNVGQCFLHLKPDFDYISCTVLKGGLPGPIMNIRPCSATAKTAKTGNKW